MLRKLIVMIMAVLMTASLAGAVEIAGVKLPEQVTINGEELVLNGAGIRKKYFISIYVAGLYLTEKTTDAQKVINDDEPMMLKLEIVTGRLTSKDFIEATLEGFEEATGGNTAPIQEEIDLFISAFADEFNPGDVFDIVYLPGEGIKVFKDGSTEPEVVVQGLEIKKALFGIWLGDRTEKRLRDLAADMLGN